MKRNKRITFINIFICLCLFSSCTMAQKEKKEERITSDSLMNITQKDFEVESIKYNKDTLEILSANKFLYYPFGIYKDFEEYKNNYLKKYLRNCDVENAQNQIISIYKGNDSLKLIETDETDRNEEERLEIISGNINDADFAFVNGVKVGMSKKDFLLEIFMTAPDGLESITVIKIESLVSGIWHYYIFSKNNTLEKIVIKTDYDL